MWQPSANLLPLFYSSLLVLARLCDARAETRVAWRRALARCGRGKGRRHRCGAVGPREGVDASAAPASLDAVGPAGIALAYAPVGYTVSTAIGRRTSALASGRRGGGEGHVGEGGGGDGRRHGFTAAAEEAASNRRLKRRRAPRKEPQVTSTPRFLAASVEGEVWLATAKAQGVRLEMNKMSVESITAQSFRHAHE